MIYTVTFQHRIGLWVLQVNNRGARYSTTRWPAGKLVTRYRRALQTECDRYEAMNR